MFFTDYKIGPSGMNVVLLYFKFIKNHDRKYIFICAIKDSVCSVLRSSGVTFKERFRFFLNLLDILESVWEREAHAVRQHEGTKSTKYSKPSEETKRNLLWNLG